MCALRRFSAAKGAVFRNPSEMFGFRRTMKRISSTVQALSAVVALCAVCAGCNIGNAPPGASNAEMKAVFDKKPIEERAKIYMSGQGTLADKQQRIKALYQAEGKVAPPEVLNPSGAPSPTGGAGKTAG
jgi:hypothetical protein